MQAPPLNPQRPPEQATSNGLAVTGFLMVLSLFLIANRVRGLDAAINAWPWEVLREEGNSLAVRVLTIAWGLIGMAMILLAFTSAWRLRATIALASAAFLLVECTQGTAGLSSSVYNFNQLFPMILLGGGLLLARREGMQAAGRGIAVLGGTFLLVALAIGFTQTGHSLLGSIIYDVEQLRKGATLPEDQPYYHWYTTLPRTLVATFAVVGLLVAIFVPRRTALLVATLGLGAGLVMPFLARMMALSKLLSGITAGDTVHAVVFILIEHGLLLWLLGVLAISDWRARESRAA